ncbi:type II toxin-antitoxin system VapC family toxin [Rivularia sp. UHCC 0363]|uniref:type II toxin-antitoxin system VapC family toxin n=1 Tax=Rivularia sp. UHCC 0363 TaxID=3110244 RepID=UPI002B20800A|nr:PIN domain-containing protein [Rivularia sp. UHCC 0363]MEA5599493.1 PIN domain-containing protein [Rivularia sp. UHCC 0363]
MSSKVAYIDSGVLINAFRGIDEVSIKATQVLDDSTRTFASSVFVQLETLPKSHYNKQLLEVEFYQTFFNAVSIWAMDLNKIIKIADGIAKNYGLAAMDALHIAAAVSINAEEFVTTEKVTKPMHRVSEIRVISIASS